MPERKKRLGVLPKIGIFVVAVFGAFLLFGGISGRDPATAERWRAADAIDLCWEEQKRKSLSPNSQQFVAGTCEMMENDFRQKYGRNP
jgi:hypothetical protein